MTGDEHRVALKSAESMGRNAGELFAAGGGSTPNPFSGSGLVLEALAGAWRQAYFKAMFAVIDPA